MIRDILISICIYIAAFVIACESSFPNLRPNVTFNNCMIVDSDAKGQMILKCENAGASDSSANTSKDTRSLVTPEDSDK